MPALDPFKACATASPSLLAPPKNRRCEMTIPQDLKTIGLTPFSYHANEPLFRINAGVPVIEP